MKNDVEIAQAAEIQDIRKIADKLAIDETALELYGKYKAKINPDKIEFSKQGKLILVSGMTPTRAGEGKSTVTIGLVDGLNSLGYLSCGALREPSLGPVFGIKGGATGGGYSQVLPMEDINLHFTGDIHAVTSCNNLIAAVIDNHIFQGNSLQIDTQRILWKRCVDLNDRALREVLVGLEKEETSRKDGFTITAASEVMAILCLAKDLEDFKYRIGEVVFAYDVNGKPLYVKDLNILGSLAVLMIEAIKPNLIQTLEHSPILMHGGPFANIAHGCNSVIATKTALGLADYVITEAGFGVDLGAEKFIDIKCRLNGLQPAAAVIVVTLRALKLHGGAEYEELKKDNLIALQDGLSNLAKHLDTLEQMNLTTVVAINRFSSDSDDELTSLMDWCQKKGVVSSLCEGWEHGSKGMQDLAKKIVDVSQEQTNLYYIYDLNDEVKTKIEKVVKKVYGGSKVEYSEQAELDLKNIQDNKWNTLPICMAKTPNSLSDDPNQTMPKDFSITIKRISVSLGAGFLVVHTGNIMTMPGLGKQSAAERIDIVDGKIVGIF
jgi:formate--tetrahydrofolate ligase